MGIKDYKILQDMAILLYGILLGGLLGLALILLSF